MSKKKSLFGGLFQKKQGGCCNIEIVEEQECDCATSTENQDSAVSENVKDDAKK